jgi:uncharacterized protein (DUF2249 family)
MAMTLALHSTYRKSGFLRDLRAKTPRAKGTIGSESIGKQQHGNALFSLSEHAPTGYSCGYAARIPGQYRGRHLRS